MTAMNENRNIPIKECRKRGMTFLSLLLVSLLSLFFLYFRIGNREAMIQASRLFAFSLLGSLVSLPVCIFLEDGKRLSFVFSSFSMALLLVMALPIGVRPFYVLLASVIATSLSFLFCLLFHKPVFHFSVFSVFLLYLVNEDGFTTKLNGRSILTNIQENPLSDLYFLHEGTLSDVLKGLSSSRLSIWELFIGDYLTTIACSFVLILFLVMLFLSIEHIIKGSAMLVFLLSSFLSFFIFLLLSGNSASDSLEQAICLLLFSDLFFLSFLLFDDLCLEKNTLSTYSLILLSQALFFLLFYYQSLNLALLLSVFFFDFLYPMFSSIQRKTVSIPLFTVSLILTFLPSVILGVK